MEIQKHNPDYKLIGVTINNKQFVFGQDKSHKGEWFKTCYAHIGQHNGMSAECTDLNDAIILLKGELTL